MTERNLRFGVFHAPFHAMSENPTLMLQRDLELLEYLDKLGWHEAWIGEHHSAGMEIIASPEIFIAAAAERTKHMRLGTGVVSLPYHHPLMVADRMMMLDHLTRGRAMFGIGPGALVPDAVMMGMSASEMRPRMEQSMSVILRLLAGETVTEKTDWFEINGGRLQLAPYTRPRMEMAVACAISPSGPRAAGMFGINMLSLAAGAQAGFDRLADHWDICQQVGAEHGHKIEREGWRLLQMMHVAETREKAIEDVRFGLGTFLDYFDEAATFPVIPPDGPKDLDERIQWMIETEIAVIGTPDDAIARMEKLWEKSGGYGTQMLWSHNWADWTETKRSYELITRYVFPHFQGSTALRWASYNWVAENHDKFTGAGQQAVKEMTDKHKAERAAKKTKAAE